MNERIHVAQVGAPDPELNNSPIAEDPDENLEMLRQELPGEPVCAFNNRDYASGEWVCSGDTLLRCDDGIWVREGTCDPDNP
ncbi:MAG TPA: hypothetical protein ENJ05_00555 [Thiotrichales bacterium]|nr:hypothetical protein [Thiotrichales bacterium]